MELLFAFIKNIYSLNVQKPNFINPPEILKKKTSNEIGIRAL